MTIGSTRCSNSSGSPVCSVRTPFLSASVRGAEPLGWAARRLTIARAFVARPDVLLADEPTEGLDPQAAAEVLLAARLSSPKMTLVLALHEQQLTQLSREPDCVVELGDHRNGARTAEWHEETPDTLNDALLR